MKSLKVRRRTARSWKIVTIRMSGFRHIYVYISLFWYDFVSLDAVERFIHVYVVLTLIALYNMLFQILKYQEVSMKTEI